MEVVPASIKNKPVLRDLLDLCQHDYSEQYHIDVDEHGLFGYKTLDHYWTEPERYSMGRSRGFLPCHTHSFNQSPLRGNESC